MAKDCDFVADKDNQIRDVVLSRCNSEYMHKNCWRKTDLTLAHFLLIATQCNNVHISPETEVKETVSPKKERYQKKKVKVKEEQWKRSFRKNV